MNKKLPNEFDYNNDFNIMPTPPTLKARELDLFMTIIKRIVDSNSRTIALNIDEVFEYIAYKGESLIEKLSVLSQFADKVLKWNIKYSVKDKNGIRFYAFVCFEKMRSAIFADELAEQGKKLFGMNNRTIEITAQEDFFKMIINKQFGWTRADMKEYAWLSSKYTKKIYPLLKQWRSKGVTPEYEWSGFKELLNIPTSYKVCDIEKQILKPAIKELTEQHNLFENNEEESHKRTIFEKLNFHKIKNKQGRGQGGKIEKIYFTFTPQREQTNEERLKLENIKQTEQIKAQAQKIEKLEKQHEKDKRENDYLILKNAEIQSILGVESKYERYKGIQIRTNSNEMLKIVEIKEFGGEIEVLIKNQENESSFQKPFATENHLRKYLKQFNYISFMPEPVY